jgi:hypothetical protein
MFFLMRFLLVVLNLFVCLEEMDAPVVCCFYWRVLVVVIESH